MGHASRCSSSAISSWRQPTRPAHSTAACRRARRRRGGPHSAPRPSPVESPAAAAVSCPSVAMGASAAAAAGCVPAAGVSLGRACPSRAMDAAAAAAAPGGTGGVACTPSPLALLPRGPLGYDVTEGGLSRPEQPTALVGWGGEVRPARGVRGLGGWWLLSSDRGGSAAPPNVVVAGTKGAGTAAGPCGRRLDGLNRGGLPQGPAGSAPGPASCCPSPGAGVAIAATPHAPLPAAAVLPVALAVGLNSPPPAPGVGTGCGRSLLLLPLPPALAWPAASSPGGAGPPNGDGDAPVAPPRRAAHTPMPGLPEVAGAGAGEGPGLAAGQAPRGAAALPGLGPDTGFGAMRRTVEVLLGVPSWPCSCCCCCCWCACPPRPQAPCCCCFCCCALPATPLVTLAVLQDDTAGLPVAQAPVAAVLAALGGPPLAAGVPWLGVPLACPGPAPSMAVCPLAGAAPGAERRASRAAHFLELTLPDAAWAQAP